MKVVLDTSVLFAVFRLERGFCADVFRQIVLQHDLFISDFILDELSRHLAGKFDLSPSKVGAIATELRRFAILVAPTGVSAETCRDPNDLPILGTALAAQADVLVTGDKDLLVLSSFQGIPILSPRQFQDQFLTK